MSNLRSSRKKRTFSWDSAEIRRHFCYSFLRRQGESEDLWQKKGLSSADHDAATLLNAYYCQCNQVKSLRIEDVKKRGLVSLPEKVCMFFNAVRQNGKILGEFHPQRGKGKDYLQDL